MDNANWRKVVQKQAYDLISHRYGLLVLLVGAILIVVSAFHFGESVVEWSTEKYAVVFNSFSDNLAGKSYRERLCLPVPIDVVYTWVNGSDPELVRSLHLLKLDMQDQLNTSREVKCVFNNCIHSHSLAIYPAVPGNFTLSQLALRYHEFSTAKKMYMVTSPVDYKNYSIVTFPDVNPALPLINKTLWIDGENTSVVQCYITSDATVQNGIPLTDMIVMSGFPHTLTEEDLKSKLPEKYQSKIEKIELHTDKGIAVLSVPDKENFDAILAHTNFTIEGKEPTFHAANLVWDLRDLSRNDDISASRFEDNEELRYSLRSLERFAPWIRHIYIVTNGQLPYWLNLENPRITIVTHEEIFSNKSHLPSFGSPAIESNLHKIPGLSDKFIYMNDDVMFGKEVWPDDFYTHSSGQKVYMTWPVPNCNEGCPSSWIKDGYCDKACNVSECEWDAGDCDGSNKNAGQQAGWAGGWGADTSGYCHSGCANNWIADRYCDTACNVLECGFDAGDCGTDKFNQLHGMVLLPNQTVYTLPPGLSLGYFNLSYILSDVNSSIHAAQYDDNKVIRTIAIAKKFDVLSVVLYPNLNETKVHFQIEYGRENHTKQLNFTLAVDTIVRKQPAVNLTLSDEKVDTQKNLTVKPVTTEETIVFKDIPDDLEQPGVLVPTSNVDKLQIGKDIPSNWTVVDLPNHIKMQYLQLTQELNDEELTETGYLQRLQLLWTSYQEFLINNKNHSDLLPNKRPIVKNKVSSKHLDNTRSNDRNKAPGLKNVQAADMPQKEASRFQKEADGSQKEAGGAQKEAADPGQQNFENNGNPAGRHLLYVNDSSLELVDMGFVEDNENKKDSSFIDVVDIQPDSGKLLPWETGSLAELQKQKELKEEYGNSGYHSRRLLDTFGDSLRHVNSLYNKAFGYTARKVPGHMPHMVDKHIMTELQARFPAEWEATSSHQVRNSKDMQFAFSYFYYLMGVKQNVTAADVFDEMDTDKSKILSDREIRTLATRLYDLPLDLQTLSSLEFMFVNCSESLPASHQAQPDAGEIEVYYEKNMPQVTRNLFMHCDAVAEIVKKNFPPKSKYKHVEVDDSEIAFKMIKTNISIVVGQLDDIRKRPKKFICLNDNIDHSQEQARTVKAILADFYESLFPIQSQFELPGEYRNRFTHIDELRQWRRYRDWLKFWTHIALVLLVMFTLASYFADKIEAAQRRITRRRSPTSTASNDDAEGQGHKEGGGGILETV